MQSLGDQQLRQKKPYASTKTTEKSAGNVGAAAKKGKIAGKITRSFFILLLSTTFYILVLLCYSLQKLEACHSYEQEIGH